MTVDPSIRAVKRLLLGTPKPIRICGVNAKPLARRSATTLAGRPDQPETAEGRDAPDDDIHNHSCGRSPTTRSRSSPAGRA
jgi:hypothetical protein